MTQGLLIAGMAAVVCGFFALALTDSKRMRDSKPGSRRVAVAAWWIILVVGWGVFAYVALASTGGLDNAVGWVATQSLVMRIAMWLFLLPWMIALMIWEAAWSSPVRGLAIVALAALTFGLAMQLYRRHRGRSH